jgi:hypothetical protein
MKSREVLISSVLSLVGSVSALNFPTILAMQQGVPSQPGTPSQPPRPANPNPAPRNEPTQPTPSNDPRTPAPNPNPTDPRDNPQNPNDAVPPGAAPRTAAGARYLRPFAFDHPGNEARFRESTQRLLTMEQRMTRSNEDLMKRLGEVRQMSAERQSGAMFEIMQQMLKNQEELQRYLIQSRTAWTGDVEVPSEDGTVPNENRAPARDGRQAGWPEEQGVPGNQGSPR